MPHSRSGRSSLDASLSTEHLDDECDWTAEENPPPNSPSSRFSPPLPSSPRDGRDLDVGKEQMGRDGSRPQLHREVSRKLLRRFAMGHHCWRGVQNIPRVCSIPTTHMKEMKSMSEHASREGERTDADGVTTDVDEGEIVYGRTRSKSFQTFRTVSGKRLENFSMIFRARNYAEFPVRLCIFFTRGTAEVDLSEGPPPEGSERAPRIAPSGGEGPAEDVVVTRDDRDGSRSAPPEPSESESKKNHREVLHLKEVTLIPERVYAVHVRAARICSVEVVQGWERAIINGPLLGTLFAVTIRPDAFRSLHVGAMTACEHTSSLVLKVTDSRIAAFGHLRCNSLCHDGQPSEYERELEEILKDAKVPHLHGASIGPSEVS
jgi:hypothetical protein